MSLKEGHGGDIWIWCFSISGGRVNGVVAGTKEALSRLVEVLSGLIIAELEGEFVESLESDARGEVLGGIGS